MKSDGICFECKKCGNCCMGSGYVFLSNNDIDNLSRGLKIGRDEFLNKYCKSVLVTSGVKLSLIDAVNGDCIFYDYIDKGCKVYKTRPLQCSTYPFWSHLVENQSNWQNAKQTCPGMDEGKEYSKEEIEKLLSKQKNNKHI